MAHQIPVAADAAFAETAEGALGCVAPDVAYRRLAIVNVVFIGPAEAGDRGWILVDAGLAGTAGFIARAAADRFGPDARPAAIVMTHAHFDHVGALEALADCWDAPIYAHALEMPYLSGRARYLPPDPMAGGGLMAWLSPFFPRGPVDVSDRLLPLPLSGEVPGLPEWRWIHTPGHTPGHVSLWRERDRLLVVGDAFVTTAQESAYAVATQEPEVHGPPTYFTPDWDAAGVSVRTLAELEPATAVAGHGLPLHGPDLARALRALADQFEEVAVPRHFGTRTG